jgi:hypothetical protein
MAVTIINDRTRGAAIRQLAAGLGGGGWTATWLAGHVFIDWPPRRHGDRRCGEGFWSRVDARSYRTGRTGPFAILQASGVPGPGDGLAGG